MRKIFFWVLAAAVVSTGCKTVQSVRCVSTSFKPVVVIGLNGLPSTIMVPFCDTLQVIPKIPDTLQVK